MYHGLLGQEVVLGDLSAGEMFGEVTALMVIPVQQQ